MAPFFPMDILICSLLSTTIIPGRMLDPHLQVIEDVFVHLHVDVGSASPIKEDPHQLSARPSSGTSGRVILSTLDTKCASLELALLLRFLVLD